MDPERLITALTAQSKGSDPKQPPGGVPELTREDKLALISLVDDHRGAYTAMMAKYAQSELAEKKLRHSTRRRSWALWYTTSPKVAIEPETADALADAAVTAFLNPRDRKGNPLGDEWVAGRIQKHRNTYLKKYKQHFARLMGCLAEMEHEGRYQIRCRYRDA